MQCDLEQSTTDMGKRRSDLLEQSSYIQAVDNDVTMILQSLQWDRKHLIEASPMISCQYNQNHRIPSDKLKDHEKECYVRSLGYSKEDLLLPEPLDEKANTLVTLNKDNIANIIEYEAKIDPGFKKGRGGEPTELLSLERLQHAYSADERRALHDATVSAAPACHDLGELALLGPQGHLYKSESTSFHKRRPLLRRKPKKTQQENDEAQSSKQKSRAEILAELRDMKRRRAKYRVAAKTRNYSDVLRDVIAIQMEHYSEVQSGEPANNSHHLDESRTDKSQQQGEANRKEPSERYKTYSKNRESKGNAEKEYENHYRDISRTELRHSDSLRDKTRRRDNSSDDKCHSVTSREETRIRDNYRDGALHRDASREEMRDTHTDKFKDKSLHRGSFRERYKDKVKRNDDYKRHARDDERRNRDDRDRHSSSSKKRNRDKKDYRTGERYRDNFEDIKKEKEYKGYKSSRNSEVKCKREDESYKACRKDKHKRYYDYEQDEVEVCKRIKQEKD